MSRIIGIKESTETNTQGHDTMTTSLNIHNVTKVTASQTFYPATDHCHTFGILTLEVTDANGNQTEIKLFHDGTLNLEGLNQ